VCSKGLESSSKAFGWEWQFICCLVSSALVWFGEVKTSIKTLHFLEGCSPRRRAVDSKPFPSQVWRTARLHGQTTICFPIGSTTSPVDARWLFISDTEYRLAQCTRLPERPAFDQVSTHPKKPQLRYTRFQGLTIHCDRWCPIQLHHLKRHTKKPETR